MRLKELETSASNSSDAISAAKATVSQLQSQVKELQSKCEDLENRSRRNNIRLVGITEDQEGTSATEFVSGVLQEVLKLDEKPLLDRAQRTLQAKPKPNQPTGPFVIRVHYTTTLLSGSRTHSSSCMSTRVSLLQWTTHLHLPRPVRGRSKEKSSFRGCEEAAT